ncbi:MAG: hypothetical protein ACLQEI_18310 [Terriglobales bacterium]
MSPQEIALERQYNDEVMQLLEARITTSGYFRKQKIPELMAILKKGSTPFGRVNTKIAFDGDTYLTIEEKRTLTLNTRSKYSRRFIEYFDPASFEKIDPKDTLSLMYLDAFHRVSRKTELERFKKLGFIRQVRIQPDNCAQIKRLKKIHPIDDVPDLPLTGCNAQLCRCYYEAIVPKEI